MRKFAFAIIVAVFMAGCAQPVVKEEVKPAAPPAVKPASCGGPSDVCP